MIIGAGISIAIDISFMRQSFESIAKSLEKTAEPFVVQAIKDAIRSVK